MVTLSQHVELPDLIVEQIPVYSEQLTLLEQVCIDGITFHQGNFHTFVQNDICLRVSEYDGKAMLFSDSLAKALASHAAKIHGIQQSIQSRGTPVQQYLFKYKDKHLSVTNYNGAINLENFISEFTQWFLDIATHTQAPWDYIHNILILPENGTKNALGESQSGEYKYPIGGFLLFPPAFEQKTHRIGNVPHLTGILTHEYAHQFNCSIGQSMRALEWMKIGGWKIRYESRGGITILGEDCTLPSELESEYGACGSAEDFCDSAIKALYNPLEFLSARKRAFFEKYFLSPPSPKKSPESPSESAPAARYDFINEFHIYDIQQRGTPQFPTNFFFHVFAVR